MITSRYQIFTAAETDTVVEIWMLSNSNFETVKTYVTVKQQAGSKKLSLELQARKKQDLWDIAYIFGKLYTNTYWKD